MGRIVTAFKEHKEFHPNKHWDANRMFFPTDVVTPPHYADTVEIIVNHGAEGRIHIGGIHNRLSDHAAYFIPPGTVHAMEYCQSSGFITILKLNHLPLKRHLDLESVLGTGGQNFDTLPLEIDDGEIIRELEEALFRSESLFSVLTALLHFFRHLADRAVPGHNPLSSRENDDLRRLIEWTERNFTCAPALEQAAAILGYSKTYFCRKFKDATGVTYGHYLNCLRIDHACAELKKGSSVTQVCYSCGFTNPSYFIKLFRTLVGVTPAQYKTRKE